MSCKKEYSVEFSVINRAQRKLQVNFRKPDASNIDSNLISRGQELILLVEMGEGRKTENYLNDLSSIPLEFIEIKDLEQNIPLCQPSRFDCWEKQSPREKEGVGTVFIKLIDADFE